MVLANNTFRKRGGEWFPLSAWVPSVIVELCGPYGPPSTNQNLKCMTHLEEKAPEDLEVTV